MEYTNPIPIWLSTNMRQIRGQYTDGRGGRCAMGVLIVPKHTSETGDEVTFGLSSRAGIVSMNDEKRMSFREIAEAVARKPDAYFTKAAVTQFRREAAIAQEFEQPASREAVTVAGKEVR